LPKAHTRDIYSASWSGDSGLIASTGSDGLIVVYGEEKEAKKSGISREVQPEETGDEKNTRSRDGWKILGTVSNGHGAYEINHVTWCKRYDAGAEQKGIEEMLVTTGDDGVIRPWQIKAE
jgi:WD40 repeat protein